MEEENDHNTKNRYTDKTIAAEYSMMKPNDHGVSVNDKGLGRLAEAICTSGIDFMLLTERMSDPVFYLMRTSSIDRCIVANALMETTIRYISEYFDGAYIDFDVPEDPYKQIKIDILRDLGYKEEISKFNTS